MKKALLIVGVLMVALVPAYIWLFLESGTPGASYPIDLDQARALAQSLPGPKPTSVRVEHVTTIDDIPAMGIVAGGGWRRGELAVYAYQLVYPSSTLVIDTGVPPEEKGAAFDDESFRRVRAALLTASLIVVTHEHFDHIGGLAAHPELPAILPRARLTRAQLSAPEQMQPAKLPATALAAYTPLEDLPLRALAPGVVLLRAPGHSPGSQLVFVQLADGRELLFIGDVAWHFANIERQRERARLVTLIIGEDRDAVLSQLRALHELHAREPKLHLVPGHDAAVIDRLIAEGVLRPHFEVTGSGS
jgi:glyoxylase-like metal-dependent hydrolase (beta-lactamase superfamily II)